ncbi:MAG: FHA domain-containing protein [Planctomycetaceae bacterium]|nr:FHA domain-containing protein [Planctomycetaceae bacterium]
MDDGYLKMLQYASAAPKPVRFLVRAAGRPDDIQTVDSAFTVIGRSDGCQIAIPDQTVSQRHALIQVLGQNVAWVDLFSTAGLKCSDPKFVGWLSPEHEMQVGGVTVQLLDDGWTLPKDLKGPLDFRPRDEQRPEYGVLPHVNLELLNTKAKGKRWPINRVITLAGRDDRCRITIVDSKISRVQCAFLLLPSGLWVIDLSGQGGIQVNGEVCPCAMLATGAELAIGPYRFGAHYPQVEQATGATSTGAQTAEQAPVSDFLTRTNKLFHTEYYYDTLIVVPVGDSRTFFYQDMHIEASRVVDLLRKTGFQHVIVDFSRLTHAAHLALEVLLTICRAAPGRVAMCGGLDEILPVLQRSPIYRLYSHYATRAEAIAAVYHMA